MRERVVIGGSIAQAAGRGGHAWVFLQYLLGFRRLGFEVFFLDRLTADMYTASDGRPSLSRRSECLRYVRKVLEGAGLGGDFAVLGDDGETVAGPSRAELLRRVRGALLVNVMGFIDDTGVLDAVERRAFLDIDPGFPQMWSALGLHDAMAGHDAFVSVGERIGAPDCRIPTCGLQWIPSPPPVVLEEWPAMPTGGRRVTSVATWRGPFAPIEYEGERYGLRVHEFRALAPLPGRVDATLELALDIDSRDEGDRKLLASNGWTLADPSQVAASPAGYRRYVQDSDAELCVAKEMYVRTHSGWFSDRSVVYLASGKPVVALDTGFGERYPTGEGLLAFRTLEEAAAAVECVLSDPVAHARAARSLAEAYFDSTPILVRLFTLSGK